MTLEKDRILTVYNVLGKCRNIAGETCNFLLPTNGGVYCAKAAPGEEIKIRSKIKPESLIEIPTCMGLVGIATA